MSRSLTRIPKSKAARHSGWGPGSGCATELQAKLVALRARMEALPDRIERFSPLDRTIRGVRRVATRSHSGNVGKMLSTRFGRVEYESPLERDFLLIAHSDPLITRIISQPLELLWADGDGVVHQHTPDFALLREGLLVIVELKTDEDECAPEIEERTEALHRIFLRTTSRYELWTGSRVRVEPLLSNMHTLLMGTAFHPNEKDIAEVLRLLRRSPRGLRAQDIAVALGRDRQFIYSVFAMALDGILRLAAPDRPIAEHGLFVGEQL